jgi:hypothetical protein
MQAFAYGLLSGSIAGVTVGQEVQSKPTRVPANMVAAPLGPAEMPTAKKTLATPELVQWLTRLVKENLPPTHEDDKNWGQTKKVWNGVRLRREGLRIETERRIRTVKTGTWTRYRIEIVDPEQNLDVQFLRLEPMPDGKVKFEVAVSCPLDVFGRLSQWVRDVQVISISANADAACRLTVTGTVGVKMNVFQFPPDLKLEPKVEAAHVELTHYEVQRLSQVRGEFAEILGDGLKGVIDKKLEKFNDKLVDKMNKQIDKQADKLSFSPQEWLKNKLPLPAAKKAAAPPE